MAKKYINKIGAGRERDYWAIKAWLDGKDMTIKEVAHEIGVQPADVSKTIRGICNHRKTLYGLIQLKCPIDILSLPLDIKASGDYESN